MHTRPPPTDDILMEASAWLARLHADNRKPEDEGLFRAWLSANPDHVRAFEAVDNSWTVLGGLPPLTASPKYKIATSRRRLLVSGVGLTVVAIGSLTFVRSSSAKVYETGIGEQKRVALDDGSRIFLNAQTRVTVQFDQSKRTADLEYGRANFLVFEDENRPFIVEVNRRRIISQQGNFDVRREGKDVQIVLLDGTAKVLIDNPADRPPQKGEGTVLHGGDRFVSIADRYRVDRPDLTPLIAWQAGRAVFENEPLMEAIQEMNLYSPEKLEIADNAAGRLRLSGVYHVGDNLSFARSISKFLPVSVRKEGDRLVLSAVTPVTER